MSTSVRTPRQIDAAISPVKVPNMIMTNGPKQLLKSEKSSLVNPESMENPTKIRATPVTEVGIMRKRGERKTQTKNRMLVTTAVRPVRPPASTPIGGFNERGDRRAAGRRADDRADGIDEERLFNVGEVSFLVKHIRLRSHGDQSAEGGEEVAGEQNEDPDESAGNCLREGI